MKASHLLQFPQNTTCFLFTTSKLLMKTKNEELKMCSTLKSSEAAKVDDQTTSIF